MIHVYAVIIILLLVVVIRVQIAGARNTKIGFEFIAKIYKEFKERSR